MLTAALVCLMLPLTSVVSAQDPTQVIAVATRDENTQISDIYTIQLNGENRTNLTQHPADDIWPAWSPDGEQIAYSSDRDGSYDIWLMSADGSNPTNLTNSTLQEFRPDWSPDGSHIMFQGSKGGKDFAERYQDLDLYVIRLEDGYVIQLTHDDLDVRGYGSWSPDGTRIMFAAVRMDEPESSDSELYIQYFDDRRKRLQVTDNEFLESAPFWISDYEVIHFYREIQFRQDDTRGYYKFNPVTGAKIFLIDPFNIYTTVGYEGETLVMLFDGLDGICYFNTDTGAQVYVDNTGPFDDSMSWKPAEPESIPESEASHRFRRGRC